MSWALLVAVLVAACVGYVVAAVVMTGRGAVAPLAPTPAEADAHKEATVHRQIVQEGIRNDTKSIEAATHQQQIDRANALLGPRK